MILEFPLEPLRERRGLSWFEAVRLALARQAHVEAEHHLLQHHHELCSARRSMAVGL